MKRTLIDMSFSELKHQLTQCKNKKKELFIRQLMMFRYNQYLERQQMNDQLQFDDFLNINDDFSEDDNNNDNKWSSYQQTKEYQYSRDKINNNLMDRLSNEILIKKSSNSNNKKNKRFIPPYEDQTTIR